MKLSLKYHPQYKSFSCGPVSLRMVFEHLGKHYSENKMISLCHAMPKIGTSHEQMIEEVEKEGFKYIQKENGTVKEIINFIDDGYPVIVNYLNPLSNGGHHTVIQGYNKKEKILIFADPSNGNDFSLHFKEFEELWHDGNNSSKGWFLVIGRDKIII